MIFGSLAGRKLRSHRAGDKKKKGGFFHWNIFPRTRHHVIKIRKEEHGQKNPGTPNTSSAILRVLVSDLLCEDSGQKKRRTG